jgi:choline dehydrogenase-like flavoprotein/pimeloyl-ACP methyl ester carboxylesterase
MLRGHAWLSRDLAGLVRQLGEGRVWCDRYKDRTDCDFDVLIVGSGYGGAVALAELAGMGVGKNALKLCLLERGREYLPGAFPSRMADVPGCVRYSTSERGEPRGGEDGLYDVRVGPDLNILLASGLGGGSLINAGVMAMPKPEVFGEPTWPQPIRRDAAAIMAAGSAMKASLHATSDASSWRARKQAMTAFAGRATLTPAEITIAGPAVAPELAERGVKPCIGCGDCATGCNHNAKLSLDVTLLADARAKHPHDALQIVNGASVTSVEQRGDGAWCVSVVHTDPAVRRRQLKPFRLHARCLILAAGSLGSTEILMRAQRSGLALSPQLGQRFSSNGDNIAVLYDTGADAGGVARETVAYGLRKMGPTITRLIDLRCTDPERSVVIEDMAVPGPLARVFEELATTARVVNGLGKWSLRWYRRNANPPDPAAVDAKAIRNSLLLALIGRDRANGRLKFCRDGDATATGVLTVDWPDLSEEPGFKLAQKRVEKLARKSGGRPKVLPNLLWRPVPAFLEDLVGRATGPMLSVHPLGGCAMADEGSSGVVNHLGQVFRGTGTEVYPNLVVLDGSIIPTSLGINPSLTIATLAQRAICALCAQWGFAPFSGTPPGLPPRPIFRAPPIPVLPVETRIEITERLSGPIDWMEGARILKCRAVVTLWYDPLALARLITRDGRERCLHVSSSRSDLKIVEEATKRVVASTPLEGTLELLRHEASGPISRAARALWAWLCNRGAGDLCELLTQRVSLWLMGQPPGDKIAIGNRVLQSLKFATRCGDVRLMRYCLKPTNGMRGNLVAVKRITYERAANPWKQLMRAEVSAFPGSNEPTRKRLWLDVDATYFGLRGMPLLRIERQETQPHALVDLASFALYILRVLLPLHLWSLRLPAPRPARIPQRLPGAVPGLPAPVVSEFAAGANADGKMFMLRLTRYRPAALEPARPPVLLVHGYSASGTTFVHPDLPGGGLVGTLCRENIDVWVLDLRSSSGMPGATEPWSFEDIGCADIPIAVDRVLDATGQRQLDIVAHCMGVAMLSLALFGDSTGKPFDSRPDLQRALSGRIRKLVISQVAPVLEMSAANIARAYAWNWMRNALELGPYELFAETPDRGDDMLDRLLAMVPYPDGDFERENPFPKFWKRTPWTRQRHRLDEIFGRTFELANMPAVILDKIDDFFGPFSLQTISQVIHFANEKLVTDKSGNASFMTPARIGQRIGHCQVLSLHAELNGIVDVRTCGLLEAMLKAAGVTHEARVQGGMGHQDSLIGKDARRTYIRIREFLLGRRVP